MQIANQIIRVLDSHRKAEQIVRDSVFQPDFFGNFGMRLRHRIGDERLHPAKAFGILDEAHIAQNRKGAFRRATTWAA